MPPSCIIYLKNGYQCIPDSSSYHVNITFEVLLSGGERSTANFATSCDNYTHVNVRRDGFGQPKFVNFLGHSKKWSTRAGTAMLFIGESHDSYIHPRWLFFQWMVRRNLILAREREETRAPNFCWWKVWRITLCLYCTHLALIMVLYSRSVIYFYSLACPWRLYYVYPYTTIIIFQTIISENTVHKLVIGHHTCPISGNGYARQQCCEQSLHKDVSDYVVSIWKVITNHSGIPTTGNIQGIGKFWGVQSLQGWKPILPNHGMTQWYASPFLLTFAYTVYTYSNIPSLQILP